MRRLVALSDILTDAVNGPLSGMKRTLQLKKPRTRAAGLKQEDYATLGTRILAHQQLVRKSSRLSLI